MAAATLALVAATPFALKYKYTYDGSAGVGIAARTQAQMVADLNGVKGPNPLQKFLAGLGAGVDWTAGVDGAQCSLYATNHSNNGLEASFNGVNNTLTVSGTDSQATTATIEVRFHHTLDR